MNKELEKRGIRTGTNIVEKIVHVEDKEKMAELEEKLKREKDEIKAKA